MSSVCRSLCLSVCLWRCACGLMHAHAASPGAHMHAESARSRWSLVHSYTCFIYTALDGYGRIEALKGDTVLLFCNTTTSGGVIWTQRTPGGDFSYLYFNGSFQSGHRYVQSRYSITQQHRNEFSLKINNVQIRDSGRYHCYQRENVRRFAYELNVTGKKTGIIIKANYSYSKPLNDT